MPVAFSDLALFSLLGITAGTLAGMLGIGGGMVIVPGLFYLFSVIHLPEAALIHMAAGSAMGIMLFTASASTWSHHARGDVQWNIFKQVVPGIGIGVVSGTLLSSHIDPHWLEIIFGVFLLVVSSRILLTWTPKSDEAHSDEAHSDEARSEDISEEDGGEENKRAEDNRQPPSRPVASAIGSLIGLKSGILGIGGGALSVPFLLYCGLPMTHASGTSAAFTLPIAITGTLAFGLFAPTDAQIHWSTGYIYWPAIALVAPFTVLGAPLGTLLSHRVPAKSLKRLFALLLLGVGSKMILGSFG
ncbi:MAG: sulfite exporter TauE/SafE family protein [Cyanobacteria bacterium P01_D01_bin.105]